MTKRTRQIYFSFTIAISVIILPLILIYSSGYRINFKTLTLEQTGALSVNTVPKNATLTIHELPQQAITPTLINNLFPNDYSITISLPNYANWNTQVTIKPTYTTMLGTVVLFHNQPTTVLSNYPTDSVELPVLPLITILDKSTGTLSLAPKNQLTNATILAKQIINYQWNTEDQLLFFTPYELKIYDYRSKAVRSVIRQSTPLLEAIWHPLNNNIIFIEQHATGRRVRVIETRFTDQPNIVTLYSGKAPEELRVNKRGDKLYLRDQKKILELQIM